jgi:hypothetical protein
VPSASLDATGVAKKLIAPPTESRRWPESPDSVRHFMLGENLVHRPTVIGSRNGAFGGRKSAIVHANYKWSHHEYTVQP